MVHNDIYLDPTAWIQPVDSGLVRFTLEHPKIYCQFDLHQLSDIRE